MDEQWKPVPGYDNYEVSNQGQVRSLFGRHLRNGERAPGRTLKAFLNHGGYPSLRIFTNEKAKTFTVHKLVLLAFKGSPNSLVTNHINGIKTDNRLVNLEYVSSSENNKHAYRLGLKESIKGELNANAKLTVEQVKAIRASSETNRVLAKRYGVDNSIISDVKNRKSWKHV